MSYQKTLDMVDKLTTNLSKDFTEWKTIIETDSNIEIDVLKQIDHIDFMIVQID